MDKGKLSKAVNVCRFFIVRKMAGWYNQGKEVMIYRLWLGRMVHLSRGDAVEKTEVNALVSAYNDNPSEDNLLAVWDAVSGRVRMNAKRYCSPGSLYPDYQEDVMQEAFLMLPEAIENYKDNEGRSFLWYFLLWYVPRAFRLACHGNRVRADLCVTAISGDLPAFKDDPDRGTIFEQLPDPDDRIEAVDNISYWKDVLGQVRKYINRLPDMQKTVARLHLFRGLSFREINERYLPEQSYSQVYEAWRNARRTLSRRLLNNARTEELLLRDYLEQSRRDKEYYTGGIRSYRAHVFQSNVERIATQNATRIERVDRMLEHAGRITVH